MTAFLAYNNIMAYQEQFDLLEAYFLNYKSITLALRWYAERYPQRQIPSAGVFTRMVENLKSEGSYKKRIPGRPQQNNLDFELSILIYFEAFPETSSRVVANEVGTSHTRVLKVLRKYGYKCYRDGRLVQALHPLDPERRLHFCQTMQTEIAQNPNFLDRIIWSDETNFSNNGMYNRRNNHYWSTENPFRVRETNNQIRFSFNCWCGIMKNRVVLVHLYEGHLNTEKYVEILQLLWNNLTDTFSEEELRNIIFQQDGAPAHNSRVSTNQINTFFQSWIGTDGNIKWPARSPDLTPLDFFLWGHVKNLVYKRYYGSVEELKTEVQNIILNIHHNSILKATRNEFSRRIRLCIRENGSHFEQFIS